METTTEPKFITCRNCDTIHSGDKWAGSDCAKGRCVSPVPALQETPARHSPLPWRIVDRRTAPLRNIKIESADGMFAAEIDGVPTRDHMLYNRKDHPAGWTSEQADIKDANAFANAELIVKCVNRSPAFQKLVEAAELLISEIGGYQNAIQLEGFTKLREALRLAREGEEPKWRVG